MIRSLQEGQHLREVAVLGVEVHLYPSHAGGGPRAQAISSLGKWSVSMASCLEENSLTFQPRSRHSNVRSHQVRISIWMVQSLCLHCEGCFQVIFQDPALMHCKSKHSFRKIPKPPLKSPGLQIYLHKYTKALATP